MKKFIFTLAIMSLSIGLSAGYHKTPDDTLQELIAPDIRFLNLEIISRGQPIYADSSYIDFGYDNKENSSFLCHIGSYFDASITTFFDKRFNPELFGMQQVSIYNYGGKGLESKIWRIEVIEDIKYAVHFYEDFCVYTSADTQFVLAN